jgi:TM2 domain-containing membrane protein YozV
VHTGVAAFLGWLLPGLGHVVLGRPGKGLSYFVVIGGAYGLGLVLTEGLGVSYARHPVWLAAQAWLAGPTVLAAWLTKDLEVVRRIPLFDVGQLYLAVAALLNLVAIADALGIADTLATRNRFLEARLRSALAAATPAPPPLAVAGHPATAAQDEWPPPEALVPEAAPAARPEGEALP